MGFSRERECAIEAGRQASIEIMKLYDSAAVNTKSDGSYVTQADLASDQIIRRCLSEAFPGDAILTEEGVDDGRRFDAPRCWIVDPIDGTASFVEKTGDFDVYIALIIDQEPVVAVTIQPTTGLLLTAVKGEGATVVRPGHKSESLRYRSPGEAIRLGTRVWLGAPENLTWMSAVAEQIGPEATASYPQDGLGVRSFVPPDTIVDAMVGFRIDGGPIDGWEWDIAAVDLIVREAGGRSTDIDGNRLKFNQVNPQLQSLLLSTDSQTHSRVLNAISLQGKPEAS